MTYTNLYILTKMQIILAQVCQKIIFWWHTMVKSTASITVAHSMRCLILSCLYINYVGKNRLLSYNEIFCTEATCVYLVAVIFLLFMQWHHIPLLFIGEKDQGLNAKRDRFRSVATIRAERKADGNFDRRILPSLASGESKKMIFLFYVYSVLFGSHAR